MDFDKELKDFLHECIYLINLTDKLSRSKQLDRLEDKKAMKEALEELNKFFAYFTVNYMKEINEKIKL